MKRIIYTIALILLTQITFGQIKTIKVKGAGGGTVDLSGIYTKAQVDSINALNASTTKIFSINLFVLI